MLDAATHWAERLSLPAFLLPAQVLVTTDENSNAWATSGLSQNSSYVTNLQEGLLTGATGDSPLASIGIGYTIDRRNFYGSSLYGDDGIITNTQGYFLRNAAGTAYLEGQYNTASYGTGLHIYGSRNTVTQQADLLSGGLAGTGIRVDGEGNRLTIAQGCPLTTQSISVFRWAQNFSAPATRRLKATLR